MNIDETKESKNIICSEKKAIVTFDKINFSFFENFSSVATDIKIHLF